MANDEHVALLRHGVTEWNQWKIKNAEIRPDLSGASLQFAKLCGADLTGASLFAGDFMGADFSHAILRETVFQITLMAGAKLCGADLRGSVFQDTSLLFVDLSDANLRDATFVRVDFNGTILRNADFTDAFIKDSRFTDNDLSAVRGLNSVTHLGPSSVGIDTIYRSRGKIPDDFLRGCGVPAGLITEMRSLVGADDGIQFYSCFISYSGVDEEFAKQLQSKMREARLRVWFAPEDMQGGKKLHEQIETAIHVYDKLLIVLSETSLRSEWVMDELRKAFKAERHSGKRKLFPVRLVDYDTLLGWECRDSSSGKDLAEELRQYFIPDFSRWKEHDKFEAVFTRLLNDLKAGAVVA